jgi:hypothetical protein
MVATSLIITVLEMTYLTAPIKGKISEVDHDLLSSCDALWNPAIDRKTSSDILYRYTFIQIVSPDDVGILSY